MRTNHQGGNVSRIARKCGPDVWVSATQTNGTLKAEQLVTVDKLTAKVSARKEAEQVRLFEINERTAGIRVWACLTATRPKSSQAQRSRPLSIVSRASYRATSHLLGFRGKLEEIPRHRRAASTRRFKFRIRSHLRGGRQKRAFDVENISPAVLMYWL